MADYTKEPRITSSQKKCTCDETGAEIRKFERCLYVPETKKVFCIESEKFKEFIKEGGNDEQNFNVGGANGYVKS